MELKQDIADLRVELKQDNADLRSELKQDIKELQATLIKWFIAIMLTFTGLLSTIMFALIRH